MKSNFLFVVLLVGVALAIGPGVKVAIKQRTIEAIKDQIVPIIMRQMREITAPDIEGNAGPIHYKIHNIRAHMENLPASNVRISLVPNSNRVAIYVGGVRASGSCRIDYKLLFIQDGFDGYAGVHDVGVSTVMAFGFDGEGRPTAQVVAFDIGIGPNNVDIQFHGSIIGELVNVVANILKPIFVGMVRQMIDSAVPPAMNQAISALIRQMPLTVDIGPNLAITFKIPQTPNVIADYFCVAIAGYVFFKPKPAPPPYEPKPCPDYEPASQKGIHFFMTDYVIRSALDATFNAGIMDIQYTVSVDDYDLTFDCAANTAPKLNFESDITVSAKAKCKIVGKKKSTGEQLEFGILTDIITNLKENIKDQTLFFTIIKLAVENMEIDNPHKYDLKWFQDGINTILAQTAIAINALLGQRGIKLPYIPGIDYSDIEEYAKSGYLEVLVTPVIHISSSLEHLMNQEKCY